MKILVDADACPVKEIIIKVAKYYNIQVIMLIDNSHIFKDDYCHVITVDQAKDSVDIALVNLVLPGDIVVSQDFGVAAMALAKKAAAINQDGLIYHDGNIDQLLFERHLGQKIRRSGGKTNTFKKRSKVDNDRFEKVLNEMIQNLI